MRDAWLFVEMCFHNQLVIITSRQFYYNIVGLFSQAEIAKGGQWPMYIFRASRRTKDGRIIYAKDYGKRAFRIWIGKGPEPDKKAKSK